jgi:D-alanyl-D-alanine carboxypeptidase/D-alanyl-D-alanine-endopeptidase (penicillin-binding protein 4)
VRALSFALALVLGGAGSAAGRPAESLHDRIEALVRGFKRPEIKLGVLVYSLRAQAAVYAQHEQDALLLASNTKLLTTAAALVALGPDFKFRTTLGTVGRDLHVFAGGDPNLSGRFHQDDPLAIFREWAGKLKAAGVTAGGVLVLHTGIFDQAHLHPGWKSYDLASWWSAPFGALSLNDNCVDLRIEPGPDGEPCTVTLTPDTRYVTVVNLTRTSAHPAKPFALARAPGQNTITLRGEVGGRATHSVAIHEPTLYFGTVLKETLAREGITVGGVVEEAEKGIGDYPDFKELAATEHDLASTLAACNQPSQNFYAEMILRTLGWKAKGKGTTENGLLAVREFLLGQAKWDAVAQTDGSGLSRENRASPADLVKLLLFMREHAYAKAFVDSLPTSGDKKGTLRHRLVAQDLRGRVHAKTGHIGGVSSLSGYIDAAGGDTYVFAILANADEGQALGEADRLEDRLCELLARSKGD